ncbi:hypothetical protein Pint_28386 [Pistacia integerrima]|uniref:Uncharacterized protein n=1 Tax=Pistacia integerrima TaxID=434235 RepID=A0ACC0YTB8_9ROSI|nr:hypothetical protein Pint_28386 [Pistacia integerrima]
MPRWDMEAAGILFDGVIVAWLAMVINYARNAKPREATEHFESTQNTGIETDEVTLDGVISVCAQLGAFKYANWISDIAERSGFRPPNILRARKILVLKLMKLLWMVLFQCVLNWVTLSHDTISFKELWRTCEDCHMFICGASQVTGIEIIVKDSMRFHHFRDVVWQNTGAIEVSSSCKR